MSEKQPEYRVNAVSIIDSVDISEISATMNKIGQFQHMVQSQLKQNYDYGVIPGTQKPTLLKPGAEKILMLLGLCSEFEIADSTRDFKTGFFQYQVRCKLLKSDTLITEGLGSCNTRERKYLKLDPYTLDNTVLKMAKKRALVDAALLVGSLSNLFTQDLEDMDLTGEKVSNQKRYATDQDGAISKAQAKRMFAMSKGNAELVRQVISKRGYQRSDQVKKIDYEAICSEIEQLAKDPKGEAAEKTGSPTEVDTGEMTYEKAASTVLTFGKHKGEALRDVPEDYLQWLVGNAKQDNVKQACVMVLDGPPGDDEFKEAELGDDYPF